MLVLPILTEAHLLSGTRRLLSAEIPVWSMLGWRCLCVSAWILVLVLAGLVAPGLGLVEILVRSSLGESEREMR